MSKRIEKIFFFVSDEITIYRYTYIYVYTNTTSTMYPQYFLATWSVDFFFISAFSLLKQSGKSICLFSLESTMFGNIFKWKWILQYTSSSMEFLPNVHKSVTSYDIVSPYVHQWTLRRSSFLLWNQRTSFKFHVPSRYQLLWKILIKFFNILAQ